MNFNRLIDAASFKPLRIQPPNSWCGHLHFAAWIIRTINPRVFVELGTHSGNSYLSFCQAINDYGLSTQCYAVDTWQGDEQAGYYGEEIFTSLNNYHKLNYAKFSRLLRMSFDEAVELFEDNSIDLLHIDGLHTYEAVRHDFETWLPKLAPDAIVMFHDTNVYAQGFGVWKYWAELKERYPAHLEFLHSYGLGVLQTNDEINQNTRSWLAPNSTYSELLQKYFYSLGNHQTQLYELDAIKEELDAIKVEVNLCEQDKFEIISLNNKLVNLNHTITDQYEQIQIFKELLSECDLELASSNYRLRRLYAPLRIAKRFINSIFHPLKSFYLSRDIHTIRSSKLFDTCFYLSQYRDVRISTCDPIRHYCTSGWKEMRNPSSQFDTNFYLSNNIDIAKSGINPFVHYILHGRFENRLGIQVLTEEPALIKVSTEIEDTNRSSIKDTFLSYMNNILVIEQPVFRADIYAGVQFTISLLNDLCELGFDIVLITNEKDLMQYYKDLIQYYKCNLKLPIVTVVTRTQECGNPHDYSSKPDKRYLLFYFMSVDVAEEAQNSILRVSTNLKIEVRTLDAYFQCENYDAGIKIYQSLSTCAKDQSHHEMTDYSHVNNIVMVNSDELPLLQQYLPDKFVSRSAVFYRQFNKETNRSSLLYFLNETGALPIQMFTEFCNSSQPLPMILPSDVETVDLTVIIPVYNQWSYTFACLNSIAATCRSEDIRYEIILADDGSTDETVNAVNYFPGLRVVKTQENLGFLRNCNHAANYARGKCILFLNNDTIVLPGWMSSLYYLMEADVSAAIIGSKLLYPDGTIQEAGSILWNDGSASNCGRFQLRNASKYAYVREVDYISGASFLVRKTFWESIGGFDERYKVAYCEDSDLAMTARSHGLRVLYQPQSEVIHFEHKSYIGERTDFLLPGQRENIQRLFDKWRNEFACRHLPVGANEQAGMLNAERLPSPASLVRRAQRRLNILYFSPFPSHPSNHGNQSTIQQFGRRFQKMGHKVHFVLLSSNLFSEDDAKDMDTCWDTLDILPNSLPLGANGESIQFDGWYEEGLGERVRGLCAKYDIDVVFCTYVFQSKLLEFIPAFILKVIDTHDKMGNRYDMLRANGQSLEFFSCTPEEEGAYLRRADVVVARREEEARYFDSVTGRSTAIVIPHVEEAHFVEKPFIHLHNVGIVASANRINLAIVREFLECINLHLQNEPYPFKLHIAGQVKDIVGELSPKDAEIFSKPWVQMHGFITDIALFYADMDLIVSPVTMGTGINVKTVQAMAFGMPLLTTAWGAKGIESSEPMHLHPDLKTLVENLFSLIDCPQELQRLAEVSRTRYTAFLEESLVAFQDLFSNPKLISYQVPETATSHCETIENKKKQIVPINKDDPGFISYLIQTLEKYYYENQRSDDVITSNYEVIKMDGDAAPSYIPATLLSNKSHEEDFSIFRAFNTKETLILDIGANWGYSASSIWTVCPLVNIVSFEPILSYEKCLQKIKELRPNLYDYRIMGLANETKTLKFAVPVINGIAISALTSACVLSSKAQIETLARNIHDHILKWMPDEHMITLQIFEFISPVRKLDNVLQDENILSGKILSAIKIDVEGYEFEVLKGAEKTLRTNKPLIMAEGGNRYDGLPDYMEALGYLYAERKKESLVFIDGIGMSVNGFFIHKYNIENYQSKGILTII